MFFLLEIGNEFWSILGCKPTFRYFVSQSSFKPILNVLIIWLFSFDASFWKIALPILVIVIPLALFSDLRNLWLYFQHRGESRKAIRVCRACLFFFVLSLACELINIYINYLVLQTSLNGGRAIPSKYPILVIPQRIVVKIFNWPLNPASSSISPNSQITTRHHLFSIILSIYVILLIKITGGEKKKEQKGWLKNLVSRHNVTILNKISDWM